MHHYSHKDLALELVVLNLEKTINAIYATTIIIFFSSQLFVLNGDGWVASLSNRFIVFWYSIFIIYFVFVFYYIFYHIICCLFSRDTSLSFGIYIHFSIKFLHLSCILLGSVPGPFRVTLSAVLLQIKSPVAFADVWGFKCICSVLLSMIKTFLTIFTTYAFNYIFANVFLTFIAKVKNP